jgi:TRAP-type C4-dicarboxylate transport system permease small subunit
MNENRTIWAWLADWLAIRRATRLVVDGLTILLAAGAVYLAWSFWAETQHADFQAGQTLLGRNIGIMFASLHAGLKYLGIVIVAVGCARIIGEGWSGSANAESNSASSKEPQT